MRVWCSRCGGEIDSVFLPCHCRKPVADTDTGSGLARLFEEPLEDADDEEGLELGDEQITEDA